MPAHIDSTVYEIVSSQVFLWRHHMHEYACGRVYASTDIVLDAAVSVAPIFKKYFAPDSCGDSSCGPNLQEPALSSKGTGKKLQHETWHLPLLQYIWYCNTHHYNFSVGTMACHVKLAVPNITAAVGLLRCWRHLKLQALGWCEKIWRPVADLQPWVQEEILRKGQIRNNQADWIRGQAFLIEVQDAYWYNVIHLPVFIPVGQHCCSCLILVAYRRMNSKQSWRIKTQVVLATSLCRLPILALKKYPRCLFHVLPLLQQVASASISQHPIWTRVSEVKLSTQFHSCILQHFWPTKASILQRCQLPAKKCQGAPLRRAGRSLGDRITYLEALHPSPPWHPLRPWHQPPPSVCIESRSRQWKVIRFMTCLQRGCVQVER